MPLIINPLSIFVHVPRTAGISLTTALQSLGLVLDEKPHTHWAPIQYRMFLGEEDWKAAYKFTIVRNPWDRMISLYEYARVNVSHFPFLAQDPTMPFGETFLKMIPERENLKSRKDGENRWDDIFLPQTHWVHSDCPTLRLDYIGRFENLASDIKVVLRRLGLTVQPLPHLNASIRTRPYRDYYDPKSRRVMEHLYGEDIDKFGYRF